MELMELRVKQTQTRFPVNILYTPRKSSVRTFLIRVLCSTQGAHYYVNAIYLLPYLEKKTHGGKGTNTADILLYPGGQHALASV